MQKNQQLPLKRDMQSTILLHSIFSTIQGEGPYCGHPAIFVRLYGCNLQCPGCDTDYTSVRNAFYPDDIVRLVNSCKIKDGSSASLVVITGGEPFRQNINELLILLYKEGFFVQIETNGTMPVPAVLQGWTEEELRNYEPETMDWRGELNEVVTVVCSPKASKIHPSIALRADCFKYVMQAGNMRQEDGLPLQALEHKATPYIARPPVNYHGKVYLQPMDEQDEVKNKNNIAAVLKSCKEHNYVLQLQVHKYIGVE